MNTRTGRRLLAVLLAAAFAVLPGAAQAEVGEPAFWTVNGERLEEGVHENVVFEGRLSIAGALGGVECNTAGTDTIWNEPGGGTTAQDEITAFEIEPGEECETSGALEKCVVEAAGVKNLNWATRASFIGGIGSVEIRDVTFTNEFDPECIIPGIEVGGLGEVVNGEIEVDAEGCIVAITFTNAGPLNTAEPNIGPVFVNGRVAVESELGNCVSLDEGE